MVVYLQLGMYLHRLRLGLPGVTRRTCIDLLLMKQLFRPATGFY